MQKKKSLVKALLLVTLILIILIFLLILSSLKSSVPENPPGTIGNTAGNLNNSGMFAERDGSVYFANTYDSGSLYVMTSEEGDIHKLNNSIVCNLLAGKDTLYYFQLGTAGSGALDKVTSNHCFMRCNQKGYSPSTITRDVIVHGQLIDNRLYLLSNLGNKILFHKINSDRTDDTDLAHYEVNPNCVHDGVIYFNDYANGHALTMLNTSDDSVSVLLNTPVGFPIYDDGYIYYLDVASNYRLCRYQPSENRIEILTSDRVDLFNVGNGYIYYQKSGSDPQLKFMHTDGTAISVLASGNYNHIHLTSGYVYFQEFGNDTSLYHSPIGSTSYSEFTAAFEAVKPQ